MCTFVEQLAFGLAFSDFEASELRPSSPLLIELPALIHSFTESDTISDRSRYGLAFLPAFFPSRFLSKAAKLGRQETMTAIADSRFVHKVVEPTSPPLVRVSTARRMSKAMVMMAQQKTPARPSFAVVRIWRVLSMAKGNAMTVGVHQH